MPGISDSLHIVTFSPGGRPIQVMDLNDGVTFTRVRGSFAFTPGAANLQRAVQARRFGGAHVVGVTHDNGSVSWKIVVKGTTVQAATQSCEALLGAVESIATNRYVEWIPFGGQASYLSLAGPGTWAAEWDPMRWSQTLSLVVTVTFPVLPLVRWAKPTIGDPFDVDSTSDYTFDAATVADVAVTGGVLTPVVVSTSLANERRARHTARGYNFLEGQATVKSTPVTTITSYKLGVMLRATDANNYIEVYVDDNGTNSRLRVDVVIAGARTNRSTTNLAARLVSGNAAWVRGRIEGNVVFAEYWSAATGTPTPMGTPTLSASYTIVGGDAPLDTTAGKSGWSWVPQNAGATLDDFDFRSSWRGLTWPRTLTPSDSIPGTGPALTDVTVTTGGNPTGAPFALLAWAPAPTTPIGGLAPFFFNPSAGTGNAVTDFTNWAAMSDSLSTTGTVLGVASATGVQTYTAAWLVDPSSMVPDDFTANELSVEVWGRFSFSVTVVSPTVVLSARSPDGVSFGAERFTAEFGTVGTILRSVGQFQTYRLGTLTLPADPTQRRTMKLWITLTTAAGTTGGLELDSIIVLPSRTRALSPTGKTLDTTYPRFIVSTAQTSKTIRSDLSSLTASPPNLPTPDHGLGGSLIEPAAGPSVWFLRLGSAVPDDPTTTTTDQGSFVAAFQVDATPRSYMLRSA